MATKPLYSRFLTSAEFMNKADAESWGKKQRHTYKGADLSVKYDVARTTNGTWKVSLYAKV